MEKSDYDELKDAYKVNVHSPSLFNYLLMNSKYDNKTKLFHQLTKEELIANYKIITKQHLEILEKL